MWIFCYATPFARLEMIRTRWIYEEVHVTPKSFANKEPVFLNRVFDQFHDVS